ncbi:MAG TPA: alkaline shock response membrane anchor protein AmaP [Thermaerobacter sp.]
MAAFNWLLSLLNSLALAAIGAVLVWQAVTGPGGPGAAPPWAFPAWAGLAEMPAWVVGVLGAAFLLSGLHVAWHAVRPAQRAAVSFTSEIGEVRTSLGAIEDLARRAGLQVAGVRDLRARVQAMRDGVALRIRAEILPDYRIPDVAPELQARLKQTIEEIVGTQVTDVRVIVERIAAERWRKPE